MIRKECLHLWRQQHRNTEISKTGKVLKKVLLQGRNKPRNPTGLQRTSFNQISENCQGEGQLLQHSRSH